MRLWSPTGVYTTRYRTGGEGGNPGPWTRRLSGSKRSILNREWGVSSLILSLLAFICSVAGTSSQGAAQNIESFRFGLSTVLFSEVNENDAKAAIKVWGLTVAKERGIQTEPEAMIFRDVRSISQALQDKQVDALGMTVNEYDILRRSANFSPVLFGTSNGSLFEEYVLLVHRDNKAASLGELRGQKVIFHQNARACMAPAWLDILLIQKGLRPAAEFFGQVSQASKLANVVLPVFFRQKDACVVTRRGFETMAELNPQVKKQLKLIISSPQVIPVIFCFRADYSPSFRDRLIASLLDLHSSPAGQQVLMIFRGEMIQEHPVSILQPTLDFLEEHRRLAGRPK